MSDKNTELEKKPESTEPEEDESGKMSFLDHLDELRKRLLHIVAYLFGGTILCFLFHEEIYNFIAVPIKPHLDKLVITKVTSGFLLYMKVALLGGVFLTIPGTLYEVWKFIAPGLYQKEKRYVIPFLLTSIVLFLLGGAFCYYYALPATVGWLLDFAKAFNPLIEATSYFDMVIMMIIGFGLIFEMPVVIAFLSILVSLAAILSPTADAFNLVIWSGPMVLLYGASIGVAFFIERLKRKKESS